MINSSIKSLLGIPVLMGAIAGCGGKGYTYPYGHGNENGTLSIAGDSQMALHGSQKITISLTNRTNITEPIKLDVTNSDNSVATIIQDTCSQNGISMESSICTFFVRGDNIGTATITAKYKDGSKVVSKTINVSRQWGPIGGELEYISELSVTGDKVYALFGEYVEVSENGSPWRLVGGGKAYDHYYFGGAGLISDGNHVCLEILGKGGSSLQNRLVKCSTNGGNWHEVGNFDADVGTIVLTGASSIYNNNIYISVWHQGSGTGLSFCSIDNCSKWQEFGQRLSTAPYNLPMGIYNTTAIAGNDSTNIYYLDSDGNWNLHGNNPLSYWKDIGSINKFGVFILPNNDTISYPYQAQIYYNDNNNIGGDFKAIGGGILVEKKPVPTINSFAVAKNNVFVALGDGKIYSSTNQGNSNWSHWKQVGNNNGELRQIYANDKNLYSIHNEVDKGYVYIYSLQ